MSWAVLLVDGKRRDELRAGRTVIFGRRGFTLVEILLAVALSALLLTIVYSTYFSISSSIEAATENQEAYETGRILSELIKRDIRGIRAGRFPLLARNEVIEGVTVGQMEFVTSIRTARDNTTLRRVGYALIINDKNEKILVRKESQDLGNLLDNTAKVFEISRIINGFQIEFHNGTDWVKDWDSAPEGTIPKQIRVVIDVADAKGHNKTFTAEESIQSAG